MALPSSHHTRQAARRPHGTNVPASGAELLSDQRSEVRVFGGRRSGFCALVAKRAWRIITPHTPPETRVSYPHGMYRHRAKNDTGRRPGATAARVPPGAAWAPGSACGGSTADVLAARRHLVPNCEGRGSLSGFDLLCRTWKAPLSFPCHPCMCSFALDSCRDSAAITVPAGRRRWTPRLW